MGDDRLTGSETDAAARAALDDTVRESYGRLLAVLAAGTRDIPAAEDALHDALERALLTWPRDGIPHNREGWLVVTARHRMLDRLRSAEARAVPLDDDSRGGPKAADDDRTEPDEIPDRRLALMFVCAHPAVDPAARTPLMLQTVLGLDAERIAGAFAVPTSAMAQRLVRAKRRIKEAGIPFAVPDLNAMTRRLPAVLEAIYGAYAIDWPLVAGTVERDSLSTEALALAEIAAHLVPREPEALGLAALICLSLARASARLDEQGRFVPIDEQDPGRWDAALIARGERHLLTASRLVLGRRSATVNEGRTAGSALDEAGPEGPSSGRPNPGWPNPGWIGRFQLEAAIQSAYDDRARTGRVDRTMLVTLHRALIGVAPTLGARVALAATVAEADGAEAGLAELDDIRDAAVDRFQPAWATRAHLLAEAGRPGEADAAFQRAIDLTVDPVLRAHLQRRRAEVANP